MRNKVLWGLVLLNVALAASLVARATGENAALAQVNTAPGNAAAGRIRVNDVIMIPGEVNGGANAVIYLIGTDNNQKRWGALAFAGQNLDFMPPIVVERLFDEGAGPASGNRTRTPTR